MSAQNLEEDAAIERIDGQNLCDLFRLLQIDIHEVLDCLEEVKASGMIPVSVSLPTPDIKVLGIPIIFEENADCIFVYSEDRSRLN